MYHQHFVKWLIIIQLLLQLLVRIDLSFSFVINFVFRLGNLFSIAFFNFAGVSVTKELSSTTRMVLDNARTIVIWAVSLAVKWEIFHPLPILGFILLVAGMLDFY